MEIPAPSLTWTWFAVAWVTLGAAVLLGVELLSRGAKVDGPLSQGHWGYSLAMSIAAILGGPLLALFGLAVGAGKLWRGVVPISGRSWWPSRADKFRTLEIERNAKLFRTSEPYPPVKWFKERLTVEQIEAAIAEPSQADRKYLIIPRSMDRWHAMKASMLPGDELRAFSSPPESWGARVGRAGIVLVRNGQAVASYVTVRN